VSVVVGGVLATLFSLTRPAILFAAESDNALNAVPFGETRLSDDGKELSVVWEDARDIARVAVRWADPQSAPKPDAVRLQYWQSSWPQRRIPRDQSSGAGSSGWLDIGDWYNGRWRDSDCNLHQNGAVWTFTFNPINAREFPNLRDFTVTYRTTLKLRLTSDSPLPKIAAVEAYTDSVARSADVAIEWGGTAKKSQTWDGSISVFNGALENLLPLNPSSAVKIFGKGMVWQSKVAGRTDGVRTRIQYAEVKGFNSFDETLVTVRAKHATFSFAMADVLREPIFIPDFGVLVKKADLDLTYAAAERSWTKRRGRSLYTRVGEATEQTFTQAWNDTPLKAPHYIPLSFEGGRQHFAVDERGEVFCDKNWIARIAGKDTARCLWEGNEIRYRFGLPAAPPVARTIEDGDLPIIIAQWERDGVRYEQTAFAVPFEGVPNAGGRIWADDTLVLMMQIKITNTGASAAQGQLDLSVASGKTREPLTEEKGLLFAPGDNPRRLRLLFDGAGSGSLTPKDGSLVYRIELQRGKSHTVTIAVPYVTLTEPAEWAKLRRMDFDAAHKAVRDYWRGRIKAGAQIHTPEPMINDFYRAHAGHLLINTEREVRSDRAMAKVGTLHYGVYSNESVMMTTDLDRRGYHDVARRAYETWLHYQGTVGLPGDFSTADGQFYGAGGYESGGYNQHHGWVLWGLGEHYWYTRDRAWLERAAPKIIKACDWITGQRQRTIAYARSSPLRAIEMGLLPPGRLEDIGDWRCWLSTNVYSWWGMDNAARALADVAHPAARRLRADAESYRRNILAAWTEAMQRSPVVKLRDGSWIPHVPSDVHRRGRSFGWITETLEGAIHLVRCGMLEPWDPRSTWIIKDFEDNLYLSEQYGYSLTGEDFDRYWFSRGGISMQANLLCNPIPYLLRDEPKHFLRAYFNAFAVSFFPDTRMMTEHALPNIGDWRGDHYKASDEANSTYWLRMMFIQERGDELLLGAAIPRYWLADGQKVGIENASTYFGPMTMTMLSRVGKGAIEMRIDPPKRNPPKTIRTRFRHPDGKPIQSVTVDGKPWRRFDPADEWIELGGLRQPTAIMVHYQ
jgi:hypothetical protein